MTSLRYYSFFMIFISLLLGQHALANTTPRLENKPDTPFNLNETQTPQTHTNQNILTNQSSPNTVPEFNAEQLLAQPELLKHAMFSSLMMRNVAAVRELLPIYRRLPEKLHDADTPIFLHLGAAQLAHADGKYSQAIQLYRQILQAHPDFALARLSLAQTLFEDRYFDQAKTEFQMVQQDKEAPPEIIALTQSYLKQIDKQDDWQFNVGANYIRDNNINNTPKQRTFQQYGGTWTLPEAQKAQGFAYHASADKSWRVRDQVSVKTGLSLYGKFYWDNHDFDDLNVRVQAGFAHQTGRGEWAMLPFVGKRWYGTKPYSHETGLRVEGAYWLTPKHRFLGAAEYSYEDYKTRQHLDGENTSVSATWLYLPDSNQYFSFGSDVNRKTAKDSSDAFKRLSVRGSWTRQWQNQGFGSTLSLDYGKREYDAADFFNVKRQDNEFSGSLTIWHNQIQYKGIVPRLTLNHQNVRSNHPAYGHRKTNAFVQLRKTF